MAIPSEEHRVVGTETVLCYLSALFAQGLYLPQVVSFLRFLPKPWHLRFRVMQSEAVWVEPQEQLRKLVAWLGIAPSAQPHVKFYHRKTIAPRIEIQAESQLGVSRALRLRINQQCVQTRSVAKLTVNRLHLGGRAMANSQSGWRERVAASISAWVASPSSLSSR
eukprot:6033149-Amphidinium_carterae.1